MKEKNILHKVLIYLNIFFSFLLLIIYISIETNPTKYGYFSLLSLLYSPVLLINLIFIIYWVIIKKSYFLLPLISILIGYEHIPKQIQFFGKNQKNQKNNVKIISFNTRNFVHNGWEENHRKSVQKDLINILNQEKGDIICLQEFPKNKHLNFEKKYESHQNMGTIIFTNKEIINRKVIDLKSNNLNSCIYIDILVKKDTIRVYNMHLESVQINQKDSFLEKIYKIKEANITRAKQVKTILNDIKKCDYPIILCGDMNNSPYSFSYQEITKSLNDAFVKSGYGLGNTFKYIIPLRIDYIFHEKTMKSYNFNTKNTKISDHDMITCNISF